MPKKTKRQTRRTPSQMAATTSVASSASASTSAFAPSMTTAGRTSDADFNPDYSSTLKDLKRIGILAGSFVVILIILSFILH